MDRVVERRAAARRQRGEARQRRLRRAERRLDAHVVGERNQQRAVARLERGEELLSRAARRVELVPFHADRRVDDEGHGQRRGRGLEVIDLDRPAAVEHLEVVAPQPGDRLPVAVHDADGERDQPHADLGRGNGPRRQRGRQRPPVGEARAHLETPRTKLRAGVDRRPPRRADERRRGAPVERDHRLADRAVLDPLEAERDDRRADDRRFGRRREDHDPRRRVGRRGGERRGAEQGGRGARKERRTHGDQMYADFGRPRERDGAPRGGVR